MSVRHSLFASAIGLQLATVAVPDARGQTVAVVIGSVIDAETTRPVPEALVTVTSPALQGEQFVITDSAGFYRLPGLPPGVYRVRVDKDRYQSFEQVDVRLRAASTVRVNLVMLPETLRTTQEVRVTERPPTIDIGSSAIGTNISTEMASRVPIARPTGRGAAVRSFESVAEVAPEARVDRYGIGIAGTTSPENRYLIENLPVNNTAYGIGSTPLSMEFVKEVNVVTGGYMPEFGRATGGVLNVVTKTGSNRFAGSIWNFTTPGALEATARPVLQEGSAVVAERPRTSFITDVGFDLGGPILKDRLWFFTGVDLALSNYDLYRSFYQTRLDGAGMPMRDQNGLTMREAIPGTRRHDTAESRSGQAIAKLTFLPSANHTLSFTSIAAPYRSGSATTFGINNQTGDPDRLTNGTFEAQAGIYRADSFDNILSWAAAFAGKKITLDTTFGWHHETYARLPSDGSIPGTMNGLAGTQQVIWRRATPGPHSLADFEQLPEGYCDPPGTAMAVRCPVTEYTTNGPGFMRQLDHDRYQARSVLTAVGRALGYHVVKLGTDLELATYGTNTGYSGIFTLREAPDGSNFAVFRGFGYLTNPDEAYYYSARYTNTTNYNFGGFLQDSWSVMDRVTLNLGVRYDAQLMYNTQGNLGLALPNQWSPRAGVIWDPTQEGRAKLFGSYARYYHSVPLDIADRSFSGSPRLRATPLSARCDPRDNSMQQTSCLDPANQQVVGRAETPSQRWETVSTGQVPVDPDLEPQSLDEWVMGGEYELLRDSRFGVSYSRRRLNQIIEDMSRDEAVHYFIGNPGSGEAFSFPKARRDYDAATAYFMRNFQGNWLAQASYTISWLRGNYSGLYRPETGQLDPNITADFDLESLLPNATGYLPGDRRHQVKLFGAGERALGQRHRLRAGIGLRATSGEPTGYLGSHVRYGVGTVFVLERGSGPRLPWQFGGDLQLGYTYAWDKGVDITALVNVFNFLNLQEPVSVDERWTNSDVLPIGGGRSPMDLQRVQTPTGGTFDPVRQTNPNFGRPTAYQQPRLVTFGLRMGF
jgi:outer membrane receptor protein involved in Fe transport